MSDTQTQTQATYSGTAHPQFERRQSAIRETLEERITAARSQKAFAKTIGISDATLIAVRDGKWESISERMLRRLESALGAEHGWPILSTRNLATVFALCEDALDNRRLVAVAASTGLGKTSALKRFVNRQGGAYVLCHSLHKPGTLLADIQQAFGLSGGASIADRLAIIVRHLRSTELPLLVLDDAGKLINACFPIIQLVFDLTEGAAGIVLGGTEHLKKVVEAGVRFDYKGFRELDRRIAYWQPLSHPTATEVRQFAAEHGITDAPAVSWLTEHTHDFGSLRNYIANATTKAGQTDSPVTRELLNDLHVGDFAYRAQAR